ARTSSPAAIAATAPGLDRPRSIRTWSGRNSRQWQKARGSRRGSSGTDGVRSAPSASACFDSVAHGAKARIGVFPGLLTGNPDDLHVTTAAEAQPLHDSQRGRARRILGTGEDLVALLAAQAQ